MVTERKFVVHETLLFAISYIETARQKYYSETGMKDDIYAVLDFGSNTVTLAVYRMGFHGFRPLHKQKASLGILRYIKDGVLSEEGVNLAAETIRELKQAAASMTDKIYCFATASLRGVSNSKEVIERIRHQAGIEVELLSGDQEAYCDYLGLTHNLPHIRNAAALDIGGGSMEIIYIRGGRLNHCISLPTGSLKLSLEFSEGHVPHTEECGDIEMNVQRLLDEVEWLSDAENETLYTIGGTARAVTKLHKAIFSSSMDSRPYSYLISDLGPLLLYLEDENHYQRLAQIVPERIQTIVPGIIALKTVAARLGAKTAVVSKYGVREGYLLDKTMAGGRL
jgi:exopolyphosphatase/guanosine-5'-triphosphate,3'-diphosphate pyrophosphatase